MVNAMPVKMRYQGQLTSCDEDCTIARCGDGTVNASAGESCDDGNVLAGDGCNADCHAERRRQRRTSRHRWRMR